MAPLHQTQVEVARYMYKDRAAVYENSWHPSYTKRFMSIVDVKPGQRVLVLACGTGLEIDIAAPRVGDEGLIVGVDATKEMLDVARRKLADDPTLARRVKLMQHDVTDLETSHEIEKASFDWILCSNAFVLFDDAAAVVRHWKGYLRDGGRMAIDITHELSFRHGLILEIVAERLGVAFPSNRRWIKSRDSFRVILEGEGLVTERIEELEKEDGKGDTYYDISEAEQQFEQIIKTPLTNEIATGEFVDKARPLFVEEWDAAAVDGKFKIVESFYLYIARKPS